VADRVADPRPPDAPADVLESGDVAGRVVRGGAQRAAGFAVANLLTAGAAVLLLRYLGVADWGRFGTVMALVAIVQGVSDAGLSVTGSREIAVRRSPEERRDVLAHVLGLRIVLTAAGVLAAIGFALAAGYDATMVKGTAIAGLGIFLISVQAAMLLPLGVELRNGTIALNEVLRQLVLVLAYAACALAGAGLVWFFGAQVIAGLVLLAAAPLMLARHHLVAPRWGAARIRELAAVAVPVAISSILAIVYVRLLIVLMSVLSDSELETGYYVTSARVIELFTGLPILFVTVVLPVLSVAARDDRGRLDYVTARTTEAMLLAGIAIALAAVLGARPLILLLGGQEYEPAVPVLQLQAAALVTIFLGAAWNPTLIGMGRVRGLVVATGLGLLAVLVAGLVLIPRHGADGAAAAAVIADVVLCAALYVALRRAGPGRRLPLGTLGRIVLAALPAVAVGALPGVPDLVLAAASVAVFLALALALRAVPPEILAAVRGRSRSA
jgi:O-antigen/teichoic acid export membrane protein